jgi:lambda family phage portal protein
MRQLGRAWWNALASTVGTGQSFYNATDAARKLMKGLRPGNGTMNEALTASLPSLRSLCRSLERNHPTARAIVEGLTATVIGTGIALEPDTGNPKTDSILRAGWQRFMRSCDATGRMDFYAMQAQAGREWATVGEFVWRLVIDPSRLDSGEIPLAVLPLESEWIYDMTTAGAGAMVHAAGIDLDKFGRPVRYYLLNPELMSTKVVEEVPASEIIHEFEHRRSLQARGEPPMAPVVERLHQEGDLVSAELEAAKNTAAMAMVITSQAHGDDDVDEDGEPVQNIRLGGVARMLPGEDVKAFSHQRPSQLIAPFRQMLRGDIAAATRVGQRWLDRDPARANYSSLRADMLDSERLLSPVREWMGHATAGRLYRAALPWLALQAGIPTPNGKYRLVPDGQPYVDPVKDVSAALAAIGGGLSTWEKEIGKRGEDAKALHKQLKEELKDPVLAGIFASHQPSPLTTPNTGKDGKDGTAPKASAAADKEQDTVSKEISNAAG